MKNSSLAECIEQFDAHISALEAAGAKAPPLLSVVPEVERPAARRLTLGSRRIQIRDQGLRPFRVS
jgi:hypothetical protein